MIIMKSIYFTLMLLFFPVFVWGQFNPANPEEPSIGEPSVYFNYETYKYGVKFKNNTNSLNSASRFLWDFGDGSTSTAKNPEHVYAKEGSYRVTLTGTNGYGKSEYTQYVNISEDQFKMGGVFTLDQNKEGVRNFKSLDDLFQDLVSVPFDPNSYELKIEVPRGQSFTFFSNISDLNVKLAEKLKETDYDVIRFSVVGEGNNPILRLWDTFSKETFSEFMEISEFIDFDYMRIRFGEIDYWVDSDLFRPRIVCYGSESPSVWLNSSNPFEYSWRIKSVPTGITGYLESGVGDIPSMPLVNTTDQLQFLEYELDFIHGGEVYYTATIPFYVYPEEVKISLLDPSDHGIVASPDRVRVSWEPLPGSYNWRLYYRRVGDNEYKNSWIDSDSTSCLITNYGNYFQYDQSYEWYMSAYLPCSSGEVVSEVRTFTIGSAPDLEVKDILVEPKVAISGKEYTVKVVVVNNGTKDLPASSWDDALYELDGNYVDRQESKFHTNESLAMGETYEVQFVLTAPYKEEIENLRLEYRIDVSNQLLELSKENNKLEIEVPISLLNIPEEEYLVLCDLYKLAGGENWRMIRPWDITTSAVDKQGWEGLTLDDEGHVTHMDLSDRNLTGTIPASLFSMPYLRELDLSANQLMGDLDKIITMEASAKQLVKIDLSKNGFTGKIPGSVNQLTGLTTLLLAGNQLKDIESVLSGNIVNLDLSDQDLTLENIRLNAGLALALPGICLYNHSGQSLESYPDFSLYKLEDQSDVINLYYDASEKMYRLRRDQSHGYIDIPSDEKLILRQKNGNAQGSRDTLNLLFDLGDANMDQSVNVADVRHTLNYITDDLASMSYINFNYFAANTFQDEMINVQDLVSTVNIVLENSDPELRTGLRALSNEDFGPVAYLSVEKGCLVINNPSEQVMDMDIILKGVTSKQLELLLPSENYLYTTKDLDDGVRFILVCVNGSGLGLGRTEIMRLKGGDPSIGYAMLTNKAAVEVPSYYEGKVVPTDNTLLETESFTPEHVVINGLVRAINLSVYDLSGRLVSSSGIQSVLPGEYTIYQWLPEGLLPGVYIIRLDKLGKNETTSQTIKFSILK